MSFSQKIMGLIAFSNNFHHAGRIKVCKPFLVDGKRVGILLPQVIEQLQLFPEVFDVKSTADGDIEAVELKNDFKTYDAKTAAVSTVVNTWRSKDVFGVLRGWRDECMNVWSDFCDPPLLKMERTAMCIFGIEQYGSHTNGYLYDKSRGLCLWVGKRSKKKSSWPGKLDQMAAGGLADCDSILGCAKRECQEEASVPDALLDHLKPVGCVSYFYEDERGLFPEQQFVFDLEVPESFTPVNADGEVESFCLMDVEQIKKSIVADEFKFNCALIMVDFFLRHGIITPDEERNYARIVEGIHKTLL